MIWSYYLKKLLKLTLSTIETFKKKKWLILYISTVNKKDDFYQKTMLHKCFSFVYMAFYIPTEVSFLFHPGTERGIPG